MNLPRGLTLRVARGISLPASRAGDGRYRWINAALATSRDATGFMPGQLPLGPPDGSQTMNLPPRWIDYRSKRTLKW